MADRVKYFLLGLLFLVVAGVIAYDRWNADPVSRPGAEDEMADRGSVEVGPGEPPNAPGTGGLVVRPERNESGPPEILPPHQEPVVPPSPRDPTPPPQPGPEPVRPTPPVPEPVPTPKASYHVVQPGETLEVIALKYYKTRDGIAWIAEANGIRDVNRIQAKQKLIVPARKESVRAGREAPAGGTRTARSIPDTYVVKSGEDLYDICRRFYGTKGEGARVAQIMELNNLWSADVRTGTKLTLPGE